MKVYRSDHPMYTVSFTDDKNSSIVPPGNEAVEIPDNLWAQYEMKIVELQQLENAIGEYFGQPVTVEDNKQEPTISLKDYIEDKWK